MLFPLACLSSLLLGAATVSPPAVPARGLQEAQVSLDCAGMVRITAKSRSGTACELVDKLRGPFANGGRVGRHNCELVLLLDAGTYKLRLRSLRKGRGQVALQVTPFEELNSAPAQLQLGASQEQVVHPGQQASYWLHVEKPAPVTLQVFGRTAGQVRLWRNGKWLDEVTVQDQPLMLRPGEPIHHQWFSAPLEAGNYLVAVYGADVLAWTEGKSNDRVEVRLGVSEAPRGGSQSATLPGSGMVQLVLTKGPMAAVLGVDAPPAASVSLVFHPVDESGIEHLDQSSGGCTIAAKQLVPRCFATGPDGASVVEVRGAPGTNVSLRWGAMVSGSLDDGAYGPPAQALDFTAPSSGNFYVASDDLLTDSDAAPLGCSLSVLHKNQSQAPVAEDFVPVSGEQPMQRSFNYDGSGATIWFTLSDWSVWKLGTGGGLKTRCALFKFDGDKRKPEFEQDPKAESCQTNKLLGAGNYELRLSGGKAGIEHLTIAKALRAAPDSPTKSACRFPEVSLRAGSNYQIAFSRIGEVGARGLVVRALPLALERPLPVTLDCGERIELPLATTGPIEVRSYQSGFGCGWLGRPIAPAVNGVCRLDATSGSKTLVLTGSDDGISLTVKRPQPPETHAPPQPFSPVAEPLPRLLPDVPLYLSFARLQSHALRFDVTQPGLYELTTLGLLHTACEVRTPAVTALAQADAGGRGRNCLIATYLRAGTYLFTVHTVDQSRGRAGVLLQKRPLTTLAPLVAGGEAFFRVPAGELVAQTLKVSRAAKYALATTALGANLSCRLEDADGWPVLAAPMPCSTTRTMRPGEFHWIQLPLTVESMRHTSLARVRRDKPLSGKTPHPIALNHLYTVKLASSGQDELDFKAQADLNLHVLLTNGMQGRLYAIAADGSRKVVEVIPPAADAPPPDDTSDTDDGDASSASDGSDDAQDSAGDDAADAESGGDDQPVSEGDGAPAPASPRPAAPAEPPGFPLHLLAGSYALVTQHHLGDSHITYQAQIATRTLAPGLAMDLQAPSALTLRMPVDGSLRLRTTGDTAVRCRIFDADGGLRAESSGQGEDWNCALAEPLAKGDYRLVIESETLAPGPTHVSAELAPVDDRGTLSDGQTFTVTGDVAVGALPPAAPDAVQELIVRAQSVFSCALRDPAGATVYRARGVHTCEALLRPAPGTYHLRVWTLDRPATVTVSLEQKPVQEIGHGGTVEPATAGLATVAAAGRYSTSRGVYCQNEADRGVLRLCEREVSLEPGPVVFAAFGKATRVKVLSEAVEATLAPELSEKLALDPRPLIERSITANSSVMLASVVGAPGQAAAPACTLQGGARVLTGDGCFAASGLSRSSLLRAWAPSTAPIQSTLDWTAVAYPDQSTPLALGSKQYALGADASRLDAPAGNWRAELTLSPESWVVELDPHQQVVDLCPPTGTLSSCELEGEGGSLLVQAPAERQLLATVIVETVPKEPIALSELYESREPAAHLRLTVPARPTARRIVVEGAQQCAIRFDDGTRLASCNADLPANMSARVVVAHSSGMLRAMAFTGSEATARFGPLPGQSAWPELPPATALALSGSLVVRSIALAKEAVVRIQSETGVCALFGASGAIVTGPGDGCDLYRLLPAGKYQVAVRGFAGSLLRGSLDWTAQDVEPLAEGIGGERWLAPGEAAFFRFTTASAGQVGIGLQLPADTLTCRTYDARHTLLGQGCQQYLKLPAGRFVLEVRAPPDAVPTRFKPVVLGLAGASVGVPEDYLRDFFQRIGAAP